MKRRPAFSRAWRSSASLVAGVVFGGGKAFIDLYLRRTTRQQPAPRLCTLEGLTRHPGRAADTKAELSGAFLPSASLRRTDRGYFDLDTLQEYDRQGVYFLSRLPSRTKLSDASGRKQSLAALLATQQGDRVDLAVAVGAAARLPCRLLAERVPAAVAEKRRQRLHKQARKKNRKVSAERLELCAWTVNITKAPPETMSLAEALVMGRGRWQIELLFKLWKSAGGLARSRGRRADRVLCEVLAKLLALVVQHGVLLTAGPLLGRNATRAARQARRQALRLAQTLGVAPTAPRVARPAAAVAMPRRKRKRRRRPSTLQTLLNTDHDQFTGEEHLS